MSVAAHGTWIHGLYAANVKLTVRPERITVVFVNVALEEWITTVHGNEFKKKRFQNNLLIF